MLQSVRWIAWLLISSFPPPPQSFGCSWPHQSGQIPSDGGLNPVSACYALTRPSCEHPICPHSTQYCPLSRGCISSGPKVKYLSSPIITATTLPVLTCIPVHSVSSSFTVSHPRTSHAIPRYPSI